MHIAASTHLEACEHLANVSAQSFSEGLKKIQAIYRSDARRITGQGLAMAREKPPAQEQGGTGKKQAQKNGKQSEIGVRADASPAYRHPTKQSPAAERRRAHTFKTRISAIADFGRRRKREKKALLLSLLMLREGAEAEGA